MNEVKNIFKKEGSPMCLPFSLTFIGAEHRDNRISAMSNSVIFLLEFIKFV